MKTGQYMTDWDQPPSVAQSMFNELLETQQKLRLAEQEKQELEKQNSQSAKALADANFMSQIMKQQNIALNTTNQLLIPKLSESKTQKIALENEVKTLGSQNAELAKVKKNLEDQLRQRDAQLISQQQQFNHLFEMFSAAQANVDYWQRTAALAQTGTLTQSLRYTTFGAASATINVTTGTTVSSAPSLPTAPGIKGKGVY